MKNSLYFNFGKIWRRTMYFDPIFSTCLRPPKLCLRPPKLCLRPPNLRPPALLTLVSCSFLVSHLILMSLFLPSHPVLSGSLDYSQNNNDYQWTHTHAHTHTHRVQLLYLLFSSSVSFSSVEESLTLNVSSSLTSSSLSFVVAYKQ